MKEDRYPRSQDDTQHGRFFVQKKAAKFLGTLGLQEQIDGRSQKGVGRHGSDSGPEFSFDRGTQIVTPDPGYRFFFGIHRWIPDLASPLGISQADPDGKKSGRCRDVHIYSKGRPLYRAGGKLLIPFLVRPGLTKMKTDGPLGLA